MSYLVVFITNETPLPGWYLDVFGPTKEVLTAEELLARTRCWVYHCVIQRLLRSESNCARENTVIVPSEA